MALREDIIHFYMRRDLRARGWELLGGQYPNGSDDELPAFSVMDPLLARDRSPDHRRHSLNKVVPDLVARNGGLVLVVEAKPTYDREDELKLIALRDLRGYDFWSTVAPLTGHSDGLA